ncbi:hypothetical protein HK097_007140 [Rhizophlyctis rosea]|uniref:Uncharacterized protein n=1 Tax=Rhizophlyctis rosea TaxID=64517 RepID=A0AAD5X1T9_9FUNG|nr:hypothetical protein HK097_007140 [Rhizophlyctis rosea]
MDLFIRLHQYAFQPGVHRPNPYVDQSKLNLNNFVRDVFGAPQDTPIHSTIEMSPYAYCESPANSSTWGDSPERFQNDPVTPVSVQSRVPALAYPSSEGDAEEYCNNTSKGKIESNLRYQYDDMRTPVPTRRSSAYPPVLMHSSSLDDDYASDPECDEAEPAMSETPFLPSSPLPTPVELLEEAYVDLSPCGDEASDNLASLLLGDRQRRESSASSTSTSSSVASTTSEDTVASVSTESVKSSHSYAANLFECAFSPKDTESAAEEEVVQSDSRGGKRLRKTSGGTVAKRVRQAGVRRVLARASSGTPQPVSEDSYDDSDAGSVYSWSSKEADEDCKIIPTSKRVPVPPTPTNTIFNSHEPKRPSFLRSQSASSLPAPVHKRLARNPVGLRRTASLDDAPQVLVNPSSIFGPSPRAQR